MLNGKIYLQYGTSSATTLYELSENSLDKSLVQALPGLHAFSGCNTTSCFEGKGTLKMHNIFSERRFQARNQIFFQGRGGFVKLGTSINICQKVKKKGVAGKKFGVFSLRYS